MEGLTSKIRQYAGKIKQSIENIPSYVQTGAKIGAIALGLYSLTPGTAEAASLNRDRNMRVEPINTIKQGKPVCYRAGTSFDPPFEVERKADKKGNLVEWVKGRVKGEVQRKSKNGQFVICNVKDAEWVTGNIDANLWLWGGSSYLEGLTEMEKFTYFRSTPIPVPEQKTVSSTAYPVKCDTNFGQGGDNLKNNLRQLTRKGGIVEWIGKEDYPIFTSTNHDQEIMLTHFNAQFTEGVTKAKLKGDDYACVELHERGKDGYARMRKGITQKVGGRTVFSDIDVNGDGKIDEKDEFRLGEKGAALVAEIPPKEPATLPRVPLPLTPPPPKDPIVPLSEVRTSTAAPQTVKRFVAGPTYTLMNNEFLDSKINRLGGFAAWNLTDNWQLGLSYHSFDEKKDKPVKMVDQQPTDPVTGFGAETTEEGSRNSMGHSWTINATYFFDLGKSTQAASNHQLGIGLSLGANKYHNTDTTLRIEHLTRLGERLPYPSIKDKSKNPAQYTKISKGASISYRHKKGLEAKLGIADDGDTTSTTFTMGWGFW